MTEPIARFVAKIAEGPSGCWLWTAGKRSNGYGQFQDRGSHRAHRWSYEFHIGPIPPGLELDHLCRVRECVNPWHLEPVTHEVNVARGLVGTPNSTKVECPSGHPYNTENTYLRPDGGRDCRRCQRQRDRDSKDRRRTKKRMVA